MSRKDRRRILTLRVTPQVLTAAYAVRRPGRSLSDILRRWLQDAAQRPYRDHDVQPPQTGRVFAVQLPVALRGRLEAAARSSGRSLAYCATQDLHAFLQAGPVAQAGHAEADPDQRRGSDAERADDH